MIGIKYNIVDFFLAFRFDSRILDFGFSSSELRFEAYGSPRNRRKR